MVVPTQAGHSCRVISVVNHVLAGAVFIMCPATLFLHLGHFKLSQSQPSETIPNITKDKLRAISSGINDEVAWRLFTRHTNNANSDSVSITKRRNTHTFQLCFVWTSHEEFKVFCCPILFFKPTIRPEKCWRELPYSGCGLARMTVELDGTSLRDKEDRGSKSFVFGTVRRICQTPIKIDFTGFDHKRGF